MGDVWRQFLTQIKLFHLEFSSRPPRQYDDVELQCVTNFDVNDYDYVYETYGFRYGIQRAQIDKAIEERRHHFIICNDISTIKKLKRDYAEVAKTIFMFLDAPSDVLLDIQRKRKISDDEIEVRLAKTAVLCRQYAENTNLFDGILPNYYNEDQAKLKHRLENLLIGFSRQQNRSMGSMGSDTNDLSQLRHSERSEAISSGNR